MVGRFFSVLCNWKQKKLQDRYVNLDLPKDALYSLYLNKKTYESFRSKDVDADEHLNWAPHIIEMLFNVESYIPECSTAIRKGVPDFIKYTALLRAQETQKLMIQWPSLYKAKLNLTFGKHLPKQFGKKVPTFSGGFLGLEEEVCGVPIAIEHLEEGDLLNHHRPEISWIDLSAVATQAETPPYIQRQDTYFSECGIEETDDTDAFKEYECEGLLQKMDISTPEMQRKLFQANQYFTKGSRHFLAEKNHLETKRESSGMGATNLVSVLSLANTESYFEPQQSKEVHHHRYHVHMLDVPKTPEALRSYLRIEPSMAHFRSKSTFHFDNLKNDMTDLPIDSEPPSQSQLDTISDIQLRREIDKVKDVYCLEHVTYVHKLLNPHGLVAAKRILWCIRNTFDDLEFCPVLPNAICIALIYLSEEETFYLIYGLIRKALEHIRGEIDLPFLVYRRNEFVQFVSSVVTITWKFYEKLARHLKKLGIDVAVWLAKHLSDGLVRAVPFNLLLRIYTAFFYEGIQVFQRYVLAVLRIHESKLLQCSTKDSAEEILTMAKGMSLRDLNAITKTAFSLSSRLTTSNIKKYSSYDLPTPYLTRTKVHNFYRPRLSEHSSIISDDYWEYIWSWQSPRFRILDPILCWCNEKHGSSIRALNHKTEAHFEAPMIMLIRTTDDEIFGGCFSHHLSLRRTNTEFIDPSESFLFTFYPIFRAYSWTGANKSCINFTNQHIIIGNEK